MTAPSSSPPAGWFLDPAGNGCYRYWDGASWTTATAAAPVAQPVETSQPDAPQAHAFAAGSGKAIVTPLGTTNVPRIVVIALLVIAVIVGMGAVQASDDAQRAQDIADHYANE